MCYYTTQKTSVKDLKKAFNLPMVYRMTNLVDPYTMF
jgi:hypothetical protein